MKELLLCAQEKKIKTIVAEIRQELTEQGVTFGEPKQGIMIETPAAVMMSEELAKEVDFFSINLRKWGSGYILLCTDGLTNYLDDKTLYELLFQSREKVAPTPEQELSKKADTLISYANKQGGSDNITALLAKF